MKKIILLSILFLLRIAAKLGNMPLIDAGFSTPLIGYYLTQSPIKNQKINHLLTFIKISLLINNNQALIN
jgi:hypothetical protein